MNRYLTLSFLAVSAAVSASPVLAQSHPAQTQMQQNIDTVLKIARNTSLTETQRIKQIEQYADRYLDYERISALAVGAPWLKFSPAQKTEFIRSFKNMIISMYAHSALLGAADAQVRLLPKMTENGNKLDVFSEVRTQKGNKYEVAYQLYRSGSLCRIYNIKVDGASLVTIYRNQFTDLIKQKGIDGTIADLKTRSSKRPAASN